MLVGPIFRDLCRTDRRPKWGGDKKQPEKTPKVPDPESSPAYIRLRQELAGESAPAEVINPSLSTLKKVINIPQRNLTSLFMSMQLDDSTKFELVFVSKNAHPQGAYIRISGPKGECVGRENIQEAIENMLPFYVEISQVRYDRDQAWKVVGLEQFSDRSLLSIASRLHTYRPIGVSRVEVEKILFTKLSLKDLFSADLIKQVEVGILSSKESGIIVTNS